MGHERQLDVQTKLWPVISAKQGGEGEQYWDLLYLQSREVEWEH